MPLRGHTFSQDPAFDLGHQTHIKNELIFSPLPMLTLAFSNITHHTHTHTHEVATGFSPLNSRNCSTNLQDQKMLSTADHIWRSTARIRFFLYV